MVSTINGDPSLFGAWTNTLINQWGSLGIKVDLSAGTCTCFTQMATICAIFDEFRRKIHGLKAEMTAVRPSYTSGHF